MAVRRFAAVLVAAGMGILGGCVVQDRRALPTEAPGEVLVEPPRGPRVKVVVGKVANQSPYQRGIFSDGVDRLGGQARAILKTRLSKSGRFDLFDRDHAEETAAEASLARAPQQLSGAELLVSGAVTEFGRRETGAQALGGILAQTKTQTAYGKVSLNIIEVRTSRVLRSFQGAGECDLTNGGVLGFGSTAGYDSTLVDKVLDVAVQEAVRKLVDALDQGGFPEIKER